MADYLSVSRSPQDALLFLETYAEKPLLPSVSLLILDNIQCVPELFTLLAALSLDYPQYHIIAIHQSFASPERYSKNDFHIISLYPLDFEEFLWANAEYAIQGNPQTLLRPDSPGKRTAPESSVTVLPLPGPRRNAAVCTGIPQREKI